MEYIINTTQEHRVYDMYKNVIADYLGYDDVALESYRIVGSDNYRFSITANLSEEDKLELGRMLGQVKETYVFLYRGGAVPITQLKAMNRVYNCIQNIGNVYYYTYDICNQESTEFAHTFCR